MAKLLTVIEAAKELGVTKSRIHALIVTRRLKAEKMGMQYFIKPKALDAVRVRKVGRPPKE